MLNVDKHKVMQQLELNANSNLKKRIKYELSRKQNSILEFDIQ
jgi:hypothetical protein